MTKVNLKECYFFFPGSQDNIIWIKVNWTSVDIKDFVGYNLTLNSCIVFWKPIFAFLKFPKQYLIFSSGPATVRMVSSNNTPPMPMPIQVPPGHMVQQIVDEQGTLRHIILSPQPPVAVTVGNPYVSNLNVFIAFGKLSDTIFCLLLQFISSLLHSMFPVWMLKFL